MSEQLPVPAASNTFERIKRTNSSGAEFWSARELARVLEYTDFRNFIAVIAKAREACANSGHTVSDHFVDITEMVGIGSGAQRPINTIYMSRYACYLIVQNADPDKEIVALGQTYFAIQTRKQELLEERIALTERLQAREKLVATETELSKIIYDRGVDGQGFGRIRSKGDQALFGSHTTMQMKKKMGIPDNRPLADFLPTITIKAKDLATEITNFNVTKKDLHGESGITVEHVKNNTDVRNLLAKSGIEPESLPPEEDIKKLERRVKTHDKKLVNGAQKLKTIDGVDEH